MPLSERTLANLQAPLGRFSRNPTMIWSMANQVIVSGFNFAIGVGAARFFGIEEFGKFSLILLIATFANIIHDTLITAPMMTLAGQRETRSLRYFSAVGVWGTVVAVLFALAVLAILATIYGARDAELPLLLVIGTFIMTAGQSIQIVVRRVLFARRMGFLAVILDAGRYGGFLLFTAIALAFGPVNATEIILALGVSALGVCLPFLFFLVRNMPGKRLLSKVWHRHWRIARWLVLMMIVSTGLEQIVWIGVNLQLGDAAVGAMRASQYLLGATHFIMLAIENFLPRQAAEEMRTAGIPALQSYLFRQTALLCAITVPVILAIAIPGELWLTFIFGADYAEYVHVLHVFGLIYIVYLPLNVWSYYLRTVERTDGIFRAYLYSTIAALVIVYPAIANAGVLGGACVILFAHIVCLAWIVVEIRRHGNSLVTASTLAGPIPPVQETAR